jgi:hypothetical protein
MMGRMEYLAQQAGFQVEKGLDFASTKTVDYFQNWDYDKSVRYFRDKFPSLLGETLWDRGVPCNLITGQLGVPCIVFVTTNYLCIQGWTKTREEVQATILLSQIASLQRAITLLQSVPSMAPVLRLPDSPSLRCDAIQIYTTDARVHQLYGFVNEKNFSDLFNVMDHAWRAVQTGSSSLLYLNPQARPGAINQVPLASTSAAATSSSYGAVDTMKPQVILDPYQGASAAPPAAYPPPAAPMPAPASSIGASFPAAPLDPTKAQVILNPFEGATVYSGLAPAPVSAPASASQFNPVHSVVLPANTNRPA